MSAAKAASAMAVAAWGALAAPACAQTLALGDPTPFPWVRWLAALAFCLVLAVAGAYVLRARTQGHAFSAAGALGRLLARGGVPPRRLAVIEAVRVSPSLEVCLLSCDGREYLLAATPQAILQLRPASGSRSE